MKYSSVRSRRLRFDQLGVSLFCLILLLALLTPRLVIAHGGVVIDSGFTPHFEWLVSIDPYPITTGQATITLLVFDLTNYDPVNDLKPTVAMAAPGTTRPCCNPAELSAPLELTIDPQIYPGDYSAQITFDQPGEWALQFVAEGGERSFTVVVPVTVKAATEQAPSLLATPDAAATATVFAQNVQVAREQNSPLAAPASPLTITTSGANDLTAAVVTMPTPATFLGFSWWVWGIAALIPIGMGWLLLRSSQQQGEEE
ncbi:MAG: hypothetical protein DYG89_04345 [Caldilinea sp. CFX5]|nr:hypothetical protein [Caldilinea sp. CFX5]